ncbi:hypothetical protein CEP54_006156 [Fusarium duplospermum]|uniref:Uncharacterized protein n=1 Tax=Fusarium duplospermum TaxID=1325734 RepID=A0A428Q8L5_9HYPO|nr:hypothetical protein CEP54_006156 [Fusarium duplospermum]
MPPLVRYTYRASPRSPSEATPWERPTRRSGLPCLIKFIEEAHPEFKQKLKEAKAKSTEKRGGANYNIGLSNIEDGVVTRFSPEPR